MHTVLSYIHGPSSYIFTINVYTMHAYMHAYISLHTCEAAPRRAGGGPDRAVEPRAVPQQVLHRCQPHPAPRLPPRLPHRQQVSHPPLHLQLRAGCDGVAVAVGAV
jgi:hypothetical protein